MEPHGPHLQMPQVKPEHEEAEVLAPADAPPDALAKLDTIRSTSVLPQEGQVIPSDVAPMRWSFEKTLPHSWHRYS